jgi:hypothetical protein
MIGYRRALKELYQQLFNCTSWFSLVLQYCGPVLQPASQALRVDNKVTSRKCAVHVGAELQSACWASHSVSYRQQNSDCARKWQAPHAC